MAAHIERMKQENKELNTKIEALTTFIYSNPVYDKLDKIEQVRLVTQLAYMQGYLRILDSRIWVAK